MCVDHARPRGATPRAAGGGTVLERGRQGIENATRGRPDTRDLLRMRAYSRGGALSGDRRTGGGVHGVRSTEPSLPRNQKSRSPALWRRSLRPQPLGTA